MSYPDTSSSARGRTIDLGERQAADAKWPRDNRKRTPRQESFYSLWAELQPKSMDEIERALAELSAQYPASLEDERTRLMTREEVRSIASDKVEFGSHAMSHASLPGLPSLEKAQEIRESVEACQNLVGKRPVTFAYPFGDFDAECQALVADAGFECAVAVETRAIAPDDDAFAFPRLKVGNWTWRQLRQELADASGQRSSHAIRA